MKLKKAEQARLLYEHNKAFVEKNIDSLGWKELAQFERKQNALYLTIHGEGE